MKQVFLSGAGQIEVLDVPVPGRLGGSALIRTAYSLISSGTESAAVTSRGGVLGVVEKIRSSRDRAEQVWQMAQTLGYAKTLELVRAKLGDLTPFGYSCAGEVLEVDGIEDGVRPGDRVACMGVGFASHAEYVVVPRNLMVRLPAAVALDEAAFGAVACIALQGIRRLELSPGERVGVIGLGLIGQLCIRLLDSMGYDAVGIDAVAARAAVAREHERIESWSLSEADSVARVRELTGGRGLDGVVVCAATKSDDPINLAFDLCRVRGRVSIVGDVGLGLQRDRMYRKELDVRMSTSYGPGRYDDEYELRGHDYPVGHVRWTEQRNLEHYLNLLASGRLSVRRLVSAVVPVDRAPDAYALVKRAGPETFGVVLEYARSADEASTPPDSHAMRTVRSAAPTTQAMGERTIGIGLIGVGSYAKAIHVPNLRALPSLFRIHGVASRSGATAGVLARKVGAPVATSDYRQLLADPTIDAVIVSTRHATHAAIVRDALGAGKHVFVEKPMTTTVEDAREIEALAARTGLVVRVGFNRRFSPFLRAMRDAVGTDGRRMLAVRVNIGTIGGDWSNTVEEGGRLLGEGCHFFDLCNWFMRAEPTRLSAVIAGEPEATNPNALVSIEYPGGSTAQLIYTALGSARLGKEHYEAFGNGRAVRTEDYTRYEAHGTSGGPGRGARGDKGQLEELREFADAIRNGGSGEGADARAGLLATWMALAAYDSARAGAAVRWDG